MTSATPRCRCRIFGIATVLLATQHAGASLVVRSRFDTEDVYRALRRPGISILQGPTMFSRLLASAPPRVLRAREPAISATGGAALDPRSRDAERYFTAHASRLRHHRICRLHVHHRHGPPARDCSSGSAVDGVEWRIGSPDRATPEPGERGTILIRGPASCWAITAIPSRRRARCPALAGYRRYRLRGCRRRAVHRRTQQGSDHPFRLQRLSHRGGIGHQRLSGVRLSAVVGRQTEDHNEVVAFVEPLPGAALDTAC